MLQPAFLRENRQMAIDALSKRGLDAAHDIDQIISLDDRRKSAQFTLDQNLAEAKSCQGIEKGQQCGRLHLMLGIYELVIKRQKRMRRKL